LDYASTPAIPEAGTNSQILVLPVEPIHGVMCDSVQVHYILLCLLTPLGMVVLLKWQHEIVGYKTLRSLYDLMQAQLSSSNNDDPLKTEEWKPQNRR
jgi:hypothetical protein